MRGDNIVGTNKTKKTKSTPSYPKKNSARVTEVRLDTFNFASDFYGPILNLTWSGYHFEQ